MPALQSVPLPTRQVLYKARAPIDYAYFPNSGIVSVMTLMENGSAIELPVPSALKEKKRLIVS